MKQRIRNAFNSDVYRNYNTLCDDIREMNSGREKTLCLQRFVKDIEKDLLDISGYVLDLIKRRHDITADEYTLLELLLSLRSWALNNLFDNHCTDEEVRRFAAVNEQLALKKAV